MDRHSITGDDLQGRYPKTASPREIVPKIWDMALKSPRLTNKDLKYRHIIKHSQQYIK